MRCHGQGSYQSMTYEPEMGWMPLSADGIAMYKACDVEAHAGGEGIHGEGPTIIGVDLAKKVFQLHGATEDRSVVFRKTHSRPQIAPMIAFGSIRVWPAKGGITLNQ